jgi:hypothetical protein
MTIVNIIDKLYRAKNNPKRLLTTGIVIHYDGVDYQTSGEALAKAIALSSVRDKSDADTIQYHYRITRDDQILYCVDDRDRLWHCGNYIHNLQSIAICIEGIGYNDTQRSLTAQLVGYLRDKYGKKLTITGHRDWQKTACPGAGAYNDIPNLNNILGANTIMELPYSKGDLIKTDTGRNTLGYRREPTTNAEALAVSGLPAVGRLPSGTVLEILGNSKESDGYLWMDVSVLPSYPNEQTFGTGWIAVKTLAGNSYTKLYKKAETPTITTAQELLNQIRQKQSEINALYEDLDKLVN